MGLTEAPAKLPTCELDYPWLSRRAGHAAAASRSSAVCERSSGSVSRQPVCTVPPPSSGDSDAGIDSPANKASEQAPDRVDIDGNVLSDDDSTTHSAKRRDARPLLLCGPGHRAFA